MKNIRLSGYVFILGLLISGCNAKRVSYDYDKSIDFYSYKSFDFHQKSLEKLEMNDLDKRRIVSTIRKNFQAKGLKEDHTDPDLHINILLFTKERVDVDVYPYASPYKWYNPCWNGSRNSYIS